MLITCMSRWQINTLIPLPCHKIHLDELSHRPAALSIAAARANTAIGIAIAAQQA